MITGAAGFIGYHVAERCLARGDRVLGVDNLNDYYDVALKKARLARLGRRRGFEFVRADVADRDAMAKLFAKGQVDRVVHLAAQAGVRYSIQNPHAYVDSNLVGFVNILEGCRHAKVRHLVYASSSSVYGANTSVPFSPHEGADHPVSLYGATKKANESMAHAYSHLYRLPVTGLRFFTVYGPWGRPDMAIFSFTRAILAGRPIDVYNGGDMWRDFTYVDDIADGVVAALDRPAAPDSSWTGDAPDPASSRAPYRVYNIGNDQPVRLTDLIAILERHLRRQAVCRMLPMQAGDVHRTHANVDDMRRDFGFAPRTPLDEGVRRFTEWYRSFYDVDVAVDRAHVGERIVPPRVATERVPSAPPVGPELPGLPLPSAEGDIPSVGPRGDAGDLRA
jgi:UDP-glucuronate 4-epimerase